MTWRKWKRFIERQGVNDATEISDVTVEGGHFPVVALETPDPNPETLHTVATITSGPHENDRSKEIRKPPPPSYFR
jgi:hypothetical protein